MLEIRYTQNQLKHVVIEPTCPICGHFGVSHLMDLRLNDSKHTQQLCGWLGKCSAPVKYKKLCKCSYYIDCLNEEE